MGSLRWTDPTLFISRDKTAHKHKENVLENISFHFKVRFKSLKNLIKLQH